MFHYDVIKWKHQSSALLALCAGNSSVPGEFPAQRPVTRSFDVFFDLRQNKRLSKQSWGWWFEALSRPLWRHSNAFPDPETGLLTYTLFVNGVPFRVTAAVQAEMYDLVDEYYTRLGTGTYTNVTAYNQTDLTLDAFYYAAAHRKEDMILSWVIMCEK